MDKRATFLSRGCRPPQKNASDLLTENASCARAIELLMCVMNEVIALDQKQIMWLLAGARCGLREATLTHKVQQRRQRGAYTGCLRVPL